MPREDYRDFIEVLDNTIEEHPCDYMMDMESSSKEDRKVASQVKKVLKYAKNCMDANPDKGGLTAIMDALEFYNYTETHTVPQSQIDQMHEWLFSGVVHHY